MTFNRRSILGLIGLGSAAGPAVLPQFGRAVMQQKLAQGGSALGGSVSSDLQYDIGYNASSTASTPIKKHDVIKLIGFGWEERLQDARDRMNAFEENQAFMFDRPSWSPVFKHYMRRQEYQKRYRALRSISDTVQDLIKDWWRNNGDNESTEKVSTPNHSR